MNTKVVLPTLVIKGGKADGGEDALEVASRLSIVGELVVIDSDAAAGGHDNSALLDALLDMVPCRMSGGFTTNERVYDWLDKGATQVIVDYKESNMGFLDGVPRDRITVSVTLDGTGGASPTLVGGKHLQDAMEEISYFAKRLLLCFSGGAALDRDAVTAAKKALKEHMMMSVMHDAVTEDDIAWIDSIGVETVLPMSVASFDSDLTLGKALAAALVSDRPDGLIPTVVVDEDMVSLGLCYSNDQSLEEAVKRKVGVYWSRSRGLWVKGLTSGATQQLLRIDLDCDRDSMRFVVRQTGVGFCHMEQMSCFGEDHGTLGALMRTLIDRKSNAPEGSYTKRLFEDEVLLKKKLLEECEELLASKDKQETAWETADVIYFAFTACARHGVTLAEVQRNLARKALRVRRRPGNAKPPGWKPGDPSPDAPTV